MCLFLDKSEIGKLISDEEHNIGAVGLSMYLSYVRAATWPLAILTVTSYVFREFIRLLLDYWLALWISAAKDCDTIESCSPDQTYQEEVYNANITYSEHRQVVVYRFIYF